MEKGKMEKGKSEMSERIINITLEIIYLLTGEDCIVVKKSSGDCVASSSHAGGSAGTSHAHSTSKLHGPFQKKKNNYQILKLANKIIELLTGEELECVDDDKDEVMEVHQPLSSPDGSSNRNTPERCPASPDPADDDLDYEVNDLVVIKAEIVDEEEMYAMGSQPCLKEETPTDVRTDGQMRQNMKGCQLPAWDVKQRIKRESPGGIPVPPAVHPGGQSSDRSTDSNPKQPIDTFKPTFDRDTSTKASRRRNKEFFCEFCGKCFTQNISRVIHQRTHTGEKPFTCAECGMKFSRKSILVSHEKTHKGEKPFPCSECGKCFAKKSDVMRHQRIHTGEKPYLCPLCGKRFSQKSHLVEHQIIHTGEKPYSCDMCEKSFTQKSHLADHKRVHLGIKPFPCLECGKAFTLKTVLVEHQRIHTGEKPFKCAVCGKDFTQRSILTKHMKVHYNEKSFQYTNPQRGNYLPLLPLQQPVPSRTPSDGNPGTSAAGKTKWLPPSVK